MIKFVFIFFLNITLIGASSESITEEAQLQRWSADLVWDKIQPALKSIGENQGVAVQHIGLDDIHGIWPGKLTKSVARKLQQEGYNAFAKDAILSNTVPTKNECTLLITSPEYADKVSLSYVRKLSPFHVIIDFKDKLADLVLTEIQTVLEKREKSQRIAVRHIAVDDIYGIWPGKLTKSVANKLQQEGYNAFAKDAVLSNTTPITEDGTLESTILITSTEYVHKVSLSYVQALKPLHVTIDFTDHVFTAKKMS